MSARKRPAQVQMLGRFAAEKCDLLAVFAQAREREAEIRLVALLLEIEADQRAPDQMGEPGGEHGVDERDPEQEARHAHIGARKGEARRQRPQDHREGDERGCLRQEAEPQREGRRGELIDVLGDALVRVVGRAAGELHAVMGRAVEPIAHRLLGHPASPADGEVGAHHELQDRARDADRRQGAEDQEELLPEFGRVLFLDGVEPVPSKIGEAHVDRDLAELDADHRDEKRETDPAFLRPIAEGPDARLSDVTRREIGNGEAPDLAEGFHQCAHQALLLVDRHRHISFSLRRRDPPRQASSPTQTLPIHAATPRCRSPFETADS